MWVSGTRRGLIAFVFTLSFSRSWVRMWSKRKHLLGCRKLRFSLSLKKRAVVPKVVFESAHVV